MRLKSTVFLIVLLVTLYFVGVPIARAEGPAFHLVKTGDTLWSISVRYGITMDALLQANRLSSQDWILTGQMLVIPNNTVLKTQYYVVRPGDTVFSISNRYGVSAWALVSQNNIVSNLIYSGQTLVIPSTCCSGDGDSKDSAGIPPPTAKPPPVRPSPTATPRRVLWKKPYTAGNTGYDISYPQCKSTLPSGTVALVIVGINGGRAFLPNPCFTSLYDWAVKHSTMAPSIYMNLNYVVGSTADNGSDGPVGKCAPKNETCKAYNYGFNAAYDAFSSAGKRSGKVWWIDLELENSWSETEAMNSQVIQGAIDSFQNQNIFVGIYSSPDNWKQIAGSFKPRHVNQGMLPLWISLADDQADAPSHCMASNAFGGGTPWLVQYPSNGLDGVYVCPDAQN